MTRRPSRYLLIPIAVILCAALVSWAFDRAGGGHSYWVSAVDFNSDGSLLATAAGDEQIAEIILWDVKTFKKVAQQKLVSGRPLWIWFAGPGNRVVLGCDVVGASRSDFKAGEITIVDLDRDEEVDSFVEPDVSGGTLELDQSRRLATYGRRSIELRGVDDDTRKLLTNAPDVDVNGIGVSSDQRHLAAACDGVALMWDLATGEELPACDAAGVELKRIAVADGGNLVAATRYELYADGAESFPVFFWDCAQSASVLNTVEFKQPVTTLRFLPGDTPRLLVVSGTDHVDCRVSIYDPTGRLLEELYAGTAAVEAVDVTPDGTRLVWVDSRYNAQLWNLAEPRGVRLWKETVGDLRSIRFSPDTQLLAGHGWSPEVEIFDSSTGKQVMTMKEYRTSNRTATILSLLPMLLFLAVIHLFLTRAAKSREAAVLAVAKQLGWQHSSDTLPERIPEFHFFKKRPSGRFEHVLLGTGDNFDTLLAVYAWTDGSGENSVEVQELCVIYPHVRSDLPELLIRPESLADKLADKLADYTGFSDVDLSSNQILERFSGRYLLRTTAPDRMPELINDLLAEFLCAHEGWNIEIVDGSVLLWWQRVKSFTRSRFSASDPNGIVDFVEESRKILHLLVPETAKVR